MVVMSSEKGKTCGGSRGGEWGGAGVFLFEDSHTNMLKQILEELRKPFVTY